MSLRSHTCQVVICLVMLGLFSPAVAQAVDVVVVKSRDLAAYDKAVAGFKETFKGSVSVVVMQGRLSDSANLASAVREAQPKAILAVGLRAANALRAEISDIPIVFCLAAHPSQNKLRAANVTGVDLEPTIKDQLRNFKEVAPRIKKLGVIYDAKRSARMVEEAKAAAVELGITLITRSVEERKDVPSALKEILNEADSLWLIRDVTVVTRELFNHTLLLQAEKKLPILVYSDQFVRKGAVCSFSASYPNQGKKAAQVVQAILDGANPGEMPVQTPEGTLFINVGSAAKADVIVPPAVLKRPGVVAIGQ